MIENIEIQPAEVHKKTCKFESR